ncbi:UNVERIFIED_CONTAM: hypothetical protein GTU68_017592 [Idotea baltica]|nr:hypothetical protein [Idotea baltica]
MGTLHDGHATLVRKSVAENDITIVSIFVNPTQFGPNEDFTQYPRNLEEDSQLLKSLGVDYVFAPTKEAIYPEKDFFYIDIIGLADKLCGSSRPGHMNGVAQVVSILFNLVQPTHAYFGLKDYQQFLIIKQLVKAFHFPLTVVPCEIIREEDGLAMSSRNLYLKPDERKQALFLSEALRELYQNRTKVSSVSQMREWVQKKLDDYPLVKLDYFEVLDGENLEPIDNLAESSLPHAFIAAYLGKTRLIDNRSFSTI